MITLYSYFRSSTSYRVRIALGIKGLAHDLVPVNILKGEQRSAEYLAMNPSAGVPSLRDHGTLVTQSMAILEYLEEKYPQPPMLPSGANERAHVRALANIIACDIHPINNLRVLNYLTGTLGVNEAQKNDWLQHWIMQGLVAFEALLAASPYTGNFCHDDTPTLADVCLVPQVFNARRFGCDLSALPLIQRISQHCEALPAFAAAHPSQQPDAPEGA